MTHRFEPIAVVGAALLDDLSRPRLLLAARRTEQDAKGWKPVEVRPRKVTTALKAYALLATSADKGAVRVVED